MSIFCLFLLMFASLNTVIGYQTVQSSNQETINEVKNQKELLFQTIIDMVNNYDIQRIVNQYQMHHRSFFIPDVRFPILNTPVLTKNQLRQMYLIGLMFSMTFSNSKMYSMLERDTMNNRTIQKEITAVIEKDSTLKKEMTQLSDMTCACGGNSGITDREYPVICGILLIVFMVVLYSYFLIPFWYFLIQYIISEIDFILQDLWAIFHCQQLAH